jgi:molybdate transport system substrate-binding protein
MSLKQTGFLLAIHLMMLCAGCGQLSNQESSQESELIIFAAASLAEAFTEMARQFEVDHPEVIIIINFAGSQQLAHQLSQGAPADIFASANHRQMEAVIGLGRVNEEEVEIFTGNRLVIIYPPGNPADIRTLAGLSTPGLKLILAAPEVPAGAYALTLFDNLESDPAFDPAFRNAVLKNVVSYEENVRAVLSKVMLGEADAGIVYMSDVSGKNEDEVGIIEIPDHLNPLATYPIATINNSRQLELGKAFIDFLLSARGQRLMSDYGFSSGVPSS